MGKGTFTSTTYGAVHKYIRRTFPATGRCEWCGRTDRPTEYAMADRNRLTRNRAEWFEFCLPCHRAFDGIGAKVGARSLGKKASAETRAKMSATQKARHKAAGGDALSPEMRAKVAAAAKASNLGRKHAPYTAERRAAISEGLRRAWVRRKAKGV